jgi:FMN phosphatase YigB (HAD superfamily)
LFRESIVDDERTLFIDDKQSNIEQAEKYGIKGYVFTSFDNLVRDREKIWK